MVRALLIRTALVCCVIVGTTVATHDALAANLQLFVATNGNDSWSGTLPQPNDEGTDGPLATLAGARDAIRARRAAAEQTVGSVTVTVHGGTYRLDTPLVLEPEDSGTPEAPVVYAAVDGERPVLSGGQVITGFEQRGPLWETVVPQVKEGQWYFHQLFVDGQRRRRARSPNDGYFRIAEQLPGPPDAQGKAIARDRFVFHAGDVAPWDRLRDVNVVLMHSWETSIHPLQSVDPEQRIVQFSAPLKEWWCIGYWEKAQRYYVENARELLDAPGEWYLNRDTGVLSYWPMPGESLGETEVVAPHLTELVRLAGNPDEERFVEHVRLEGLTLHHSDWVLDPKGNSSTQAAVEVPAAVTADGALNCGVIGCEVAHVGTYGIWFRRGCKDCSIQRNRLYDLGAGGVRVGEDRMAEQDVAESSRNLVDNNHIFDGGHVYPAGVGIWVAQSSHNRISHNDIHDLLYSGLSIGWNWGLERNRTHHNIIEYNHVHNLVHGVLSDAGLIYTLGVSPGSVIRNNVFHDIWPYSTPPFGWGIYLDAQCGSYLVEGNLVYNTHSGGLMFNNGGHQHVIQNNIFALSANHALWPYSEKRPSTFRRNIVYLTQGELLIPYGERSLNERLAASESPGDWDHNTYWHTGGAEQLRFYRHSFEQWQKMGLDSHSEVADPRFVNAAEHDFRLRPDSPALQRGFQPLDIDRVGLYGDAAWTSEVSHRQCPRIPLPAPPPLPEPLRLNDGFEDTAVGELPTLAVVSGEGNGASIRVSDAIARTGQHSLRISDAPGAEHSWQPHFYYQPHITSGVVRQSFDVWFDDAAEFFTEWRDSTAYPDNVGPGVRFEGSGKISVGGRHLTVVPSRKWLHVVIESPVGKNDSRLFTLTLQAEGADSQVFTDLSVPGGDFSELRWLGFSSTAVADTVFYVDNLRIDRIDR